MKTSKVLLTILSLLTVTTLAACDKQEDFKQGNEAATPLHDNLNKANSQSDKTNIDKVEEAAKAANETIKGYVKSQEAKDALNTVKDAGKSAADSLKGKLSKGSNNEAAQTNVDNGGLENLEFQGNDVIEVNNNKSTVDLSEWTTSKITYSPLDSLNRVGTATAYLNKSNYGKSEGREGQTWQPTGWHNQAKRVNGKKVHPFDRGHLIAYTISFNFDDNGNYKAGELGSIDNPKNLATQTNYTNRVLFQRYEEQVRDSIKANHKVIYKVTPVFKGIELLARGFQLQAKSDDGSLDFNVYVFNRMDGLNFDYATGNSTVE